MPSPAGLPSPHRARSPTSSLAESVRAASPSYSDRTAPGDPESNDMAEPDTGDEDWADAPDIVEADDLSAADGHEMEVIQEEGREDDRHEPGVHKIVTERSEEKDTASQVIEGGLDEHSSAAVSPAESGTQAVGHSPSVVENTDPLASTTHASEPSSLSQDAPSSIPTAIPASATTLTTQSTLERNHSRRRSTVDRSNRFSGFLSNLIHRRPDREPPSTTSAHTPSRVERESSPTPEKMTSRPSSPTLTSRPVTPPPSLPPPTLQELGLSLTAVTSSLTPSHFNTPPASGTFLAPHYLLLCHAQGLDVLPLVSPPAPQPYALVRRVSFKSVVVMEERGVLVAIAGRRDGVRVYALAEVKKAVEWRVDVEIRRERERQRREEAKKGVVGGVDKVFGELRGSEDTEKQSKASLSTLIPTATLATPKPKRKKSSTVTSSDAPPPNIPRPRTPTTRKVKTPPQVTTPPTREISDPPPAYATISPTRPRLRSQPSAISISQSRSRSGSVTNVLAGSTARRRGSLMTQRDGDEKGDWMDEHGSSDDEAINLVTAGPSGSAALDERTSAMAAASSSPSATVPGANLENAQGAVTLEVPPMLLPEGPRRVQTATIIPSLNRRNRPSHLDLTRATTTTAIPTGPVITGAPPSPTPTLFTLRQALSVLPPADDGHRSPTPDMDGEEDDDGTPLAEPISFAQALMESRLPGLPPPGTRRPQEPILIGASHSIVGGDEEPSSPRESASEAHSTATQGSTRTISRRRRRWSVLDGFFSQSSVSESSQALTVPSAPDLREESTPLTPTNEHTPTRLTRSRSQSDRTRPPSQPRTPTRPSSSPSETPRSSTLPPPLPPTSPSHHKFLSRIITQAFHSRRSDEASSPTRNASELAKRPSGSSLAPPAPAPKLEYVKLPGTKGAVMIKAVETSKKSFLAILCGDAGEKVELFAGTYRTTLGLSRTFILPDSPRSLELQLQGDDLVEVFLVFSQNVFGLEPATVRVREVRVGRAERRAARRRNRETRIEEQPTEADGPALGDDETNVVVSASVVPLATSEPARTLDTANTGASSATISRQTSDGNITPSETAALAPTVSTTEEVVIAPSHMGPYTTFQQLSFSPHFPLAAIADECVIPPTYPSFLEYRTEHEPGGSGMSLSDLATLQFSPPGLPVPLTLPPSKWFYRDPKGVVQGPWKASLMQSWYKDGLLPPDLPVRREEDADYTLLKDLRLQSVDPTHPFRPPPPPLNSPVYPLISDPVKPLLSPISLLSQPRHYGPPALFFSTRSGHSTAIVDARGRSVLKGRFIWTPDEDEGFTFVTGHLGDVKRLEAFDVRGRAVLVAIRQGGMEVVDVGDALLRPADESRTALPNFNPPISNTGRRGSFIWKIGSPLNSSPVGPVTSVLPKTPVTPSKKSNLGIGRSPGKPEFPVVGEDAEHRMRDELLFLGRRDEDIYFCERNTASFRILRLCPDPTRH